MYRFLKISITYNYKFKILYYRSKEWVNLCRRANLMDKTPKYLNNNCKLCSKHCEDCIVFETLLRRLVDNFDKIKYY